MDIKTTVVSSKRDGTGCIQFFSKSWVGGGRGTNERKRSLLQSKHHKEINILID